MQALPWQQYDGIWTFLLVTHALFTFISVILTLLYLHLSIFSCCIIALPAGSKPVHFMFTCQHEMFELLTLGICIKEEQKGCSASVVV